MDNPNSELEPKPKPKLKPKPSASDRIYAFLGIIFPNCGDALRLVETGQQRPLKLRERIGLVYNSPLCLHCNCKREKFDKERAKYNALKESRKG